MICGFFSWDNDWFKVGTLAGLAVAWLAVPLQPVTDKMIEYANGGGCAVIVILCFSAGFISRVFSIDHFTPGIIAALVAVFALMAVECVIIYRWAEKIKSQQKNWDSEKTDED